MASRRAQSIDHPTARLLGTSPAMTTLRTQIQQLMRFDTLGNPAVPTLLLQGETGTGKSFVARVVHDSGPRATGPFIAVNCATFPETMLEAELFGFEAGAFTDAKRAKPGLFEVAAGGTLLLDEIDAVPLALQGKLLTALESKRVRRLGAVAERVVDVKLIAATNADLGHAVATGRVRTDLYHRLAVVVLTLPPLRERGDDVLMLAQVLLERLTAVHGLPPKRVQADAEQWLQQYAWPGNVRELEHLLERVTLLHGEETVDAATLARWCQVLPSATRAPAPPAPDTVPEPQESAPPPQPAVPPEAQQLQEALVRAGGNLAQAARLLGLSRDQLRTRMQRYGLTRPRLTPVIPSPSGSPVGQSPSQATPLEPVPVTAPMHDSVVPQAPTAPADPAASQAATPAVQPTPPLRERIMPAAERRQLTVLLCELADATMLVSHLDPEEWQAVVAAYHTTCAEVIAQFEGFIAQYLGDGVLIYFGYPQAHEDDVQRAVRAGLALVEAIGRIQVPGPPYTTTSDPMLLHVRLGLHTGLVVIGALDAAGRPTPLALGDAPAVAARMQTLAAPDTVVLSEATARLVAGYVRLESLGTHTLPGLSTPMHVYRALGESLAQTRLEVARAHGLTPLVGREIEVALLQERWALVQAGLGQVVVLSGEAGIGKSRLVQVVREQVVGERATYLVCQCSPSQQHSPLAPLITALQRALNVEPTEIPEARLHALEQALAPLPLPLHEVVPLFAALLSLPLPTHYPPLTLTPQQQKQQTLDALLLWLVQETERQPKLLVVEDLHWIDPSTLEWLTLVLDQVPATQLYVVLTCRPEFTLPWSARAHLTALTLSRLPQPEVKRMLLGVTGGKPLPAEVVQRVVSQTDGVPLFVEELTKMVLESGWLEEEDDAYALTTPLPPLAIPTTLQGSLMARLDRLGSAKAVAQLGAIIGRQFAYAVLQAVAPHEEAALQQDLARLVAAELLYQRGVPPQATYRFKHALIQEAAYQSLLRRTRQQYHRQIAQVLTERFPETVAIQPELLAQHYTEGGMTAQAVTYWQRAGLQALQRSANLEAVQHLSMALSLLMPLPETSARAQQELDLQIALGPALMAARGWAAPEVEQTYARARALCTQLGETSQLFPTLWGLWRFYQSRGVLPTARDLGEQLMRLAERTADPTHRLEAHVAFGQTLFQLGEYAAARQHLDQGIALIDSMTQRALVLRHGDAPGVVCLSFAALTLWCLGYPAQAVQRSQEALALAQALDYPFSLAAAQHYAAFLHHHCHEALAVQTLAGDLLTLATAQGFPLYVGYGTYWRGWAHAMQGEAGLMQMRQGLAAVLTTGQTLARPFCLVLLAEVAVYMGQIEEGLRLVAEALAAFEKSGRGDLLAEAYRLQGALLLHQAVADTVQAEACLQQALVIARRQQARSWELRAAMSLSRLWQQQGKRAEAYALLDPIYGWFTEGFDTTDLQDARDLLDALV